MPAGVALAERCNMKVYTVNLILQDKSRAWRLERDYGYGGYRENAPGYRLYFS